MSKWVVKRGDSCPQCGAAIEVLVGKDAEVDSEEGIESPRAERCTRCDWEHNLEDGSREGKSLI